MRGSFMGSLATRGLSVKTKRYLFCYLALLPVVLLFVWLRVGPAASTINLSFHDWNLIRAHKPFVGLKNYINLFNDRLFLISLRNTTIFAFATVVFGMLLALPLALALNRPSKLTGFYQAVYFLPVITPMVPVSVIFKWIYDPGYGLLNYLLSFFGVEPIGWLMFPNLALASIIVMCIWKNLGYHMIMLLVGLKNIPGQYYEAAAIDGANKWQIFWKVTLPLLKPILMYVFITTSIEGFNIFTPVYVMTTGSQGAPGNSVRTLVYNIYEDGFRYFKMGYASSQAVMLLLIVLAVTMLQMKMLSGDDASSSVQ
ncbi:MAG TPA: sugar ABC transporter permease [Firmicutes bacterium]|nr:sugar ABC transporter permease [Bacillota bacterium]